MERMRGYFFVGVYVLILVLGLAVSLTHPVGDFFLNDDWVFARAVRDFQSASFSLDPFIVPVFMGQLFYAKFFTGLFGFSATVLRFSTLVIAGLGVFCLYRLLFLRTWFSVALLSCFALVFHPLFFVSSFSFMTDVPALACVMISLLFYRLWWESPRLFWLWVAQFFALYAAIIRQNYFAVFIASIFLLFLQSDRRQRMVAILGGFVPACLLAGGVYVFFHQRHWWPVNIISFHVFEDTPALIRHVRSQLFFIWQYIGFFLWPVLLLAMSSLSRRQKWGVALCSVIGAGLNIVLFLYHAFSFPFFENVWTVYGLGVRTDVLSGTSPVLLSSDFSLFLTVIAGAASGALLFFLCLNIRSLFSGSWMLQRLSRGWEVFLGMFFLSQVGALILFRSFDRYYLSLFAPALLWLVFVCVRQQPSRVARGLACLWVIGLATFSIFGTREYIAFTRAKWRVAETLVQQGVPVSHIDGGYEWLGWRWYGKSDPVILPYYDPEVPWYVRTLMPDVSREYVVSYSSVLRGYRLLDGYPYEHFFSRSGMFYVLKKEAGE